MTSSFLGIETSKRALFAEQTTLNTVAHNISNANTQGYTRQRVNLQATEAYGVLGSGATTAAGQLGTGVEAVSIARVRESFLDDQFRNQNDKYGEWTMRSNTMEKLQAIANEPSDTGLRTVLNQFWQDWATLSQNPQDLSNRKALQQDSQALTDSFHSISSQLNNLSSDLTQNIGTNIEKVNSLTGQIANLNLQIKKIQAAGKNPNDLEDQRDNLTDQLSNIANVTVTDGTNGYTIKMGSVSLVAGSASTNLTTQSADAAYAAGDLKSGQLYGMYVSRDQYVADYQNQLDTLANTIATGDVTITIPKGSVLPDGTTLNGQTYTGSTRTLTSDTTVTVKGVNGLHKLGYTLQTPLKAGGDFFVAKDGGTAITASNIELSPDIVTDAANIASSMRTTLGSSSPETVLPGNNELALLMSQLKDTKFSFASASAGSGSAQTATVDDYYNSIIGQLGVQGQEATRQLDNQKVIVDQVDANRQSVSGVSLDSEMADMIKYQHAYAAAARVMTTMDQNLSTIIDKMGLVGR